MRPILSRFLHLARRGEGARWRIVRSALVLAMAGLVAGGTYALAADPSSPPCGDTTSPPPTETTPPPTETTPPPTETTPPPTETTPPPPTRPPSASGLFAADSVWNKPLANTAELDPSTAMYVTELNRLIDKFKAAADGPQFATRQYSTPVFKVPADQPTVRVKFDGLASPEGDSLQAAFEAVPIPPHAKAADGLDQHMTVWQPSTDKLWELWKAQKQADGWHARYGGAIEHVSTDPGYYRDNDTWPGSRWDWGTTGSGLPVVGGTVLIKEAQEGRIDHALAFALPTVRHRWYTFPAHGSDGNSALAASIPEGARFRLDPTLDLESLTLPPFAKMLARAMQKYGIIVRDVGGLNFYGEDHTTLPTNPWPAIIGPAYPSNTWSMLAKLPWKRMQLLKMDLKKNDSDP